jgi:hypothetical protein
MERQRLKPKDLEPMIGQRKISIQKPIAPRLGSVLLPLQWPTTTAYSLRVLPQTPPRTIRAPVGAAPPPRLTVAPNTRPTQPHHLAIGPGASERARIDNPQQIPHEQHSTICNRSITIGTCIPSSTWQNSTPGSTT